MEEEITNSQSSDNNILTERSFPESHEIGNSTQNTIEKSCECGKDDKKFSRSYVYAIGRVVHRFPNLSLELELKQATGPRSDEETRGRTREEIEIMGLQDPANRYITRQVCYVLKIEEVDTYILVPSDPSDLDRLAGALRPIPGVGDINVIIGRRGPLAPPEMCNGLVVPVVMIDQIYSFDKDTLLKSIPKPKTKSGHQDQFRKTSDALFSFVMQMADNAGATDEHRAVNYLAVRFGEIYPKTQMLQDEDYSFTGMDVRPSRLSGARRILDVIFRYENRATRAIQKWFVRVDVTDEFPFLVSTLQEFFER